MTDSAQGVSDVARGYRRGAALLTVGIGASGLITYVYFALASNVLTPVQYGEIVVVWSAVFIIASVLYRPVEQLLSRTIAERDARGQPSTEPIRVAAAIQFGLAAVFAAAALLLRDPIEDGLLAGNSTLYWIFVFAVLAYAFGYFARGFLAGRRRFAVYGTLLLTESISRAGFALVVAVGVASGQSMIALGIVAAPWVSLIALPLVLIRRGRPTDPADRPTERSDSPEFTLARGGGFAAAVMLIMLSEQVFLNGGPLLVRATSGPAEAGFIFNVLLIARAPIVLFQAVATSLLPSLTRLRSLPGDTDHDAFRRLIGGTLTAVCAFTLLVAATVLVAGPWFMQLAFGDNFSYDRVGLLFVTVGLAFYLSAMTLTQVALAEGRIRRAAACWVASALAFVIWNLLPLLEEVRRVETGFAGAAALLFVSLIIIYANPSARPDDEMESRSPEELDARLAAADQAV
jgi:O-antigen/teichoic acid export membrane protein